MNGQVVTLAAEGVIDFAILRRLVRDAGMEPGSEYGGRGKQHLDSRLAGYNRAAAFTPWVVVRDLDRDADCAPALARRLLRNPSALMRLRIVVRAAEAWLLADRRSLGEVFRIPQSQLPHDPEAIEDPKLSMLRALSQSSSASVRDAMMRRERDGSYVIGPEYNARLGAFAEERWQPTAAQVNAPSLARARRRIERLRAEAYSPLPIRRPTDPIALGEWRKRVGVEPTGDA